MYRRINLGLTLAATGIALAALLVRGAPLRADETTVPIRSFIALNGGTIRPEPDPKICASYSGGKPCHFSPVREGTVDGYRVVVILMDNGTNGEASSAHLFVHGAGGNGGATADLGLIPAYQGDRMDALFAGGKLYLTNEIYLPGEAHCCGTHIVASKFGFEGQKLVFYGSKTFPISDRNSAVTIGAANYVPYDANWLLRAGSP
jgi:hypothetical protein